MQPLQSRLHNGRPLNNSRNRRAIIHGPAVTSDAGSPNRAFCDKFSVVQEHTVGRKLYELGNEEWDIPKLRIALETIISGEKTFEDFEVEQFFPSIGQRVMCLNARKVYRPGNKIQLILLAIEDITERVRLGGLSNTPDAPAYQSSRRF